MKYFYNAITLEDKELNILLLNQVSKHLDKRICLCKYTGKADFQVKRIMYSWKSECIMRFAFSEANFALMKSENAFSSSYQASC